MSGPPGTRRPDHDNENEDDAEDDDDEEEEDEDDEPCLPPHPTLGR